jgi:RNA helicase HrpA
MSELPILAKKKEILDAIRANQVTIVVGETGSGKTTQIPIFLYEDGYATNDRRVGVTQPRRIAATSVAAFVAKQIGTELGDAVGYQIRFDDQTADTTQVKFMTDGILLQEIQTDTELSQYSVIMVDEAHERSENIDFLLGLLKDLLKRRSDLKVVVTSATIDEQKFSRYFGNAPIVNVSGRMYPVDIIWSDTDYSERQMVNEVVSQVAHIHQTQPSGDILVFMTGRDDIMAVIAGLEKRELEDLLPLPVYGELSTEDQQKIFSRYLGKRKVVVATNIAETSITVDGVVYVVDSGFIKQSNFHSDTGIKSLDVVEHSQAGCNQRAGRAGRVQSGVCYRMYTNLNFKSRPAFTTPEILRVSLADVVLKMENIGIENIEEFDFIDPPDREAFHEAYETLIALGAIHRGVKGLTDIGRAMARLPLDPRIARMVLEAEKHGCVKNVATVAAFLSVRNVFVRPKDSEWEADAAHEQFKDEKSDAITFLNIWKRYEASNFDGSWCYRNFLNAKTMGEVRRIREQLFSILQHHGMQLRKL